MGHGVASAGASSAEHAEGEEEELQAVVANLVEQRDSVRISPGVLVWHCLPGGAGAAGRGRQPGRAKRLGVNTPSGVLNWRCLPAAPCAAPACSSAAE